MKMTQISPFVKLIIGLLVVALLTGCAYNGVLGVTFALLPAEEVAGALMEASMYGQNEQALEYYTQLQSEYADLPEAEQPQWYKEQLAGLEAALNPETTNFRYEITNEAGGILFGNYNGESYISRSYDWRQRFVGTDEQRRHLEVFEQGNWEWQQSRFDYLTNTYLKLGEYRYPVTDEMVSLKGYTYFDELGNLYDENDVLLAYIKNAENIFDFTVEEEYVYFIDTKYYIIDPAEGYPEEFAYYNDYGKVFDSDFNYLTTFDEYNATVSYGYNATPRPTPVNGYSTSSRAPKILRTELPVIVAVDTVMTNEEYNALYEACYSNVIVQGYIPLEMTVTDRYSALYDFVMGYARNKDYVNNAIGMGLGALVLMLVLVIMAGKRNKEGEFEASGMGRMPWDLWLVCLCGAIALAGCMVYGAAYLTVEVLTYRAEIVSALDLEPIYLSVKLCVVGAALCMSLLVGAVYSVAARVKVKGWWRNCLCGKLCVWVWKLCVKCIKWLWRLWKRIWGGCKRLLGGIPLMWRATAVLSGIMLVEIIFCAMIPYGVAAVGMLLAFVKFLACLIICFMLKRLQQGAHTIADGNLDHRIDTKNLYFDFKDHAECLNRIGEGLSHNVDARLRSERMKTELITNVSHDLKTPLTSIVNYVDLLKKENLTGNAGEYVEVLDRQSARLKKLTEDLVEASKASTGALNVSVERVSLSELLEQAQAEYALRLKESDLHAIVRQADGEVAAWADGKYVWRILDNLLSNVCKYAMPNTRVYLELRAEGDTAMLSVKNISRESLNISAEELMERFVRGDSSRNTEGSGLGLSIAQSLAKLMGGEVRITVDGDLFKADVILPIAK